MAEAQEVDVRFAGLSEMQAAAMPRRSLPSEGLLDDAAKAAVVDDASATALMLAEPSIIKRPVVQWPDGQLTLGFSAEMFEKSAGGAPK